MPFGRCCKPSGAERPKGETEPEPLDLGRDWRFALRPEIGRGT